jgi:hypothetical protein
MKQQDWMAYLDTLPPDHRSLAQKIMARVQTVLNSDRRHNEQRSDHNSERINELALRLDSYEEQRAADVRAELERFAKEQLSADEQSEMLRVLYLLTARVDKLEDRVQPDIDQEA